MGDTDDDDGGAQAVAGSGEPPGSETHAGADTGTCATTCAAHAAASADTAACAAHAHTSADISARAANNTTARADISARAAPGNHAAFGAKANTGADKPDAAADPHR